MKTRYLNHDPINFDFFQSSDRFFVEEIPLYQPTKKGAYLYLKIEKTDLSTLDLVHIISKATNLDERDIGYAGLKDKNATTVQYITIPKKSESLLKLITTSKIKILEKHYTKFPIKIGHLKANHFSIILNKIDEKSIEQINKILNKLQTDGFPNYYGYQRFGVQKQSIEQGKKIAHSGKKLKGAKEKLLVGAYQSFLFNEWLNKRVEISKIIYFQKIAIATKQLQYPSALIEELKTQKQFFKLFLGDIIMNYPYGKIQTVKNMQQSAKKFDSFPPTGLLSGSKAIRASSDAYFLEENYDDIELQSLKGDRRYAWVWPNKIKKKFNAHTQSLTLEFDLLKGTYATTFLEELAQRELY